MHYSASSLILMKRHGFFVAVVARQNNKAHCREARRRIKPTPRSIRRLITLTFMCKLARACVLLFSAVFHCANRETPAPILFASSAARLLRFHYNGAT